MDSVFKKLQWQGQDPIYVLRAPSEFSSHMEAMARETTIRTGPSCRGPFSFVLVFVKSCADLNRLARRAVACCGEGAILWFAYPKRTSTRYTSDLSRDEGWETVEDLGYHPVRQVAIDDDWSALRFRHEDE
jgi:hypothetical protein